MFEIKFGIYGNLNLLNLVAMFIFSFLEQKYPFGKIGSKKSKLLISDETWLLDSFEYVNFD